PIAAAMRAKSCSGTRTKPNRNAAPQCSLLRMNESSDSSGLIGASREGRYSTSRRKGLGSSPSAWKILRCRTPPLAVKAWNGGPGGVGGGGEKQPEPVAGPRARGGPRLAVVERGEPPRHTLVHVALGYDPDPVIACTSVHVDISARRRKQRPYDNVRRA